VPLLHSAAACMPGTCTVSYSIFCVLAVMPAAFWIMILHVSVSALMSRFRVWVCSKQCAHGSKQALNCLNSLLHGRLALFGHARNGAISISPASMHSNLLPAHAQINLWSIYKAMLELPEAKSNPQTRNAPIIQRQCMPVDPVLPKAFGPMKAGSRGLNPKPMVVWEDAWGYPMPPDQ